MPRIDEIKCAKIRWKTDWESGGSGGSEAGGQTRRDDDATVRSILERFPSGGYLLAHTARIHFLERRIDFGSRARARVSVSARSLRAENCVLTRL